MLAAVQAQSPPARPHMVSSGASIDRSVDLQFSKVGNHLKCPSRWCLDDGVAAAQRRSRRWSRVVSLAFYVVDAGGLLLRAQSAYTNGSSICRHVSTPDVDRSTKMLSCQPEFVMVIVGGGSPCGGGCLQVPVRQINPAHYGLVPSCDGFGYLSLPPSLDLSPSQPCCSSGRCGWPHPR